MANEPKGVTEPKGYIAQQQRRLIQYVAKKHHDAKTREKYEDNLAKVDPTLADSPWYLGKDNRIVGQSLSADGRYMFVALVDKNYKWRSDHDIMPNYLGQEGYVDAVPARARVAEDNYPGQDFVVLDLKTHTKHPVTIEGLTGYNQDVLAKVKAENAKAKGKTYESKKITS